MFSKFEEKRSCLQILTLIKLNSVLVEKFASLSFVVKINLKNLLRLDNISMSHTIFNAKHALYSYFLQEDSFRESQVDLVQFECEDKEVKLAIVKRALQELCESKIVLECQIKGKKNDLETIWALTKPLALYEQSPVISLDSAIAISKVINNYCSNHKLDSELCDCSSIKECDIVKLLVIIESLSKQDKKTS